MTGLGVAGMRLTRMVGFSYITRLTRFGIACVMVGPFDTATVAVITLAVLHVANGTARRLLLAIERNTVSTYAKRHKSHYGHKKKTFHKVVRLRG